MKAKQTYSLPTINYTFYHQNFDINHQLNKFKILHSTQGLMSSVRIPFEYLSSLDLVFFSLQIGFNDCEGGKKFSSMIKFPKTYFNNVTI